MVEPGPALNLAKNILNNDSQLPAGVSVLPYSFSGTEVSVHSPVNINIYDSFGNHTGPTVDGNFETNIPGSAYDTLDDAKFIFLPDSGQYDIRLEATDQGSFDFKIRKYENDTNTETIFYQNIPIASTSAGETTFDTNSAQPPDLLVDQRLIPPPTILEGDASYDQTPPASSYQLNGSSQNVWFKGNVSVSLSAVDEASGSGVAKIEYSIDNGSFQLYTSPFIISKEGTTNLKINSTDLAGNQESPQNIDIKIDKTPPEAKANFNLQNQAIEVIGVDNLSAVTVSENPPGQINLADSAGNQTKLTVAPTTVPRKTKIIFATIKYNSNPSISLPTNELDTTLKTSPKTNRVAGFTQKLTVPGQTLSSSFDTKANITTITIGQKKPTQTTITEPGMTFLQLLTNKGQLETKY